VVRAALGLPPMLTLPNDPLSPAQGMGNNSVQTVSVTVR
jgi:hypothetical protein